MHGQGIHGSRFGSTEYTISGEILQEVAADRDREARAVAEGLDSLREAVLRREFRMAAILLTSFGLPPQTSSPY